MTSNKQTKKININKKNRSAATKLSGFIPAAKKAVQHTTKAVPKPTKNGVLYKHREYIAQVVGATTFNAAQRQLVNPGNQLLFPWLSTVAGAFEKFKIHKFKLQYEHQVGTDVGGFVGGYIEYDPSDAPPANLSQLLNNFDTVSGAPYDDFSITYHKAEEGLKNYFVDPAQGSTGFDANKHPAEIRFYTVAPLNANVGLLWVDYEIELLVPNVKGTGTLGASIAGWYSASTAVAAYDQYYEAWNRMSQPNIPNITSDVMERGPYTIGSDFSNRSRINMLIPGNYNDLFTPGSGNNACLFFDSPGTYQVDLKFNLYLDSTDATVDALDFAFDDNKIGPNSTCRYVVQEVAWPGLGFGSQITISMLLVITDVATRVAWRTSFQTATTAQRKILGFSVVLREVSEELLTGILMKAIDILGTGEDPTLSNKRQQGNVRTEGISSCCPKITGGLAQPPVFTEPQGIPTNMGPGQRIFQLRQ